MEYGNLVDSLAESTGSKILLAVMDGVGDIPITALGGRTPLEAADTPNLDGLAKVSALGQHIPVARGITPGSGPAHMALFGYDPLEYQVGRGVLAALGVGFDLQPGDLAARINFCTIDSDGVITDRRAGRIPTEKCTELVKLLSGIGIDGIEIHVMPVKEHRACVVFRGEGLSDAIADTDPGLVGRKALPVTASSEPAGRSAGIVSEFIKKAALLLQDQSPANHLLLRGFAVHRLFRSMAERFSLKAGAAALYPMYRGVASLVGMEILACADNDIRGEVASVKKAFYDGFTFVFMHHKPTDSSGEDGDWKAKISAIEVFDRVIPDLMEKGPDVICVTGDHCTPCSMKLHSWHPVPLMIHGGPQRTGFSSSFGERSAMAGSLGTFRAVDLVPLLLASAGKLRKFGA